jgi:hypothetical protein
MKTPIYLVHHTYPNPDFAGHTTHDIFAYTTADAATEALADIVRRAMADANDDALGKEIEESCAEASEYEYENGKVWITYSHLEVEK